MQKFMLIFWVIEFKMIPFTIMVIHKLAEFQTKTEQLQASVVHTYLPCL